MAFSCQYGSKARFAAAWKETALGFEMSDVQLPVLLALASVFERTQVVCGVFASAVVPQSGQRYNMVREARVHILFCGRGCCLLEGIEVSALPGYDCVWIRIACKTVLLLVGVGSFARLAVSLRRRVASLQTVSSYPER